MSLQFSELWKEKKFRLLTVGIAVVGCFEVLSFGWYQLPRPIALPVVIFFILVVGSQTILSGLKAAIKADFQNIALLIVIAVIGAFILEKFEEAAILVMLYTLGEYLEEVGIESSRKALDQLLEKMPKTALVKGTTEKVPIEQLSVGTIISIQPGDLIPVDGLIMLGETSVDESTITGEPIPKDKHSNDQVFAGTLNLQGYIEVKTTKTADKSTVSTIAQLAFEAVKMKAPTHKFIERFAKYYTPSILVVAILIPVVQTLLLDKSFYPWLQVSLVLLVIACPCALVISIPISMYAAIGTASQKGIVIKGGKYIEELGKVQAVAFDKTRTITTGVVTVTDVIPISSVDRETLLACAAGMEQYSEHPLAQAIVKEAKNEQVVFHQMEQFQAVFGKGVSAKCLICNERSHAIGKLSWISELGEIKKQVLAEVENLQRQGKTAVIVMAGTSVEGIIAIADTLKKDSSEAIAQLISLGITPVMLTGDNSITALQVATTTGISRVKAELLPEDKVTEIGRLQNEFRTVAMVGDGINDTPALIRASVGITMGSAGSDTALESAPIAIMNDSLMAIPFLIRLGRATSKTVRNNIILALSAKAAFIILAIAGISSIAMAIFADVGITLIIILYSLRLLNFS